MKRYSRIKLDSAKENFCSFRASYFFFYNYNRVGMAYYDMHTHAYTTCKTTAINFLLLSLCISAREKLLGLLWPLSTAFNKLPARIMPPMCQCAARSSWARRRRRPVPRHYAISAFQEFCTRPNQIGYIATKIKFASENSN
jgi:hypothetical protein